VSKYRLTCIYSALSAPTRPIPTVCFLNCHRWDVTDTLAPLILAFEVPDSGTYWYHSHLSTQYLDGLRGVIVVYVCVSRFSEVLLISCSGSRRPARITL